MKLNIDIYREHACGVREYDHETIDESDLRELMRQKYKDRDLRQYAIIDVTIASITN